MNKLIHIQLMEEYQDIHYNIIIRKLSEYFKRISDDTFELKEGVFLKFDKNELLIYEDDEKEESGDQK